MQKYYCDCCGREIQKPRNFKIMKHIQDIFETGESERKDNNGDYISNNQLSFEICQKCYNLIMLRAYEEFRTIYNKIDKNEQKGLTKEKKMMFKSIIDKASSPKIDLNKIREGILMTISSEILLNIHLNHEECILLKEILKQAKSSNCSDDTENFIGDMLDGLNDFLEYN